MLLRAPPRVSLFLLFSGGGVSGGLGASIGARRRRLLVLRLGEFCALVRSARLVCLLPFAVERALLPHPGGSFGATGSGSASSMWSRMVAPDHSFLCYRWGDNGRWVFIVLGTPSRVLGINSCGDSSVWSCSPLVAGGFLPGFIVRRSVGLVRSYGWRRRCCVSLVWTCVYFA
jgi:hypothetical protein